MLVDTHVPAPTITVNAAPLPGMVADQLTSVVVEAQRNLPAHCEVTYADEDGVVSDLQTLRPGAALRIVSAPAVQDPTARSLGPLFDGEIVAIEANFHPDGGRHVVLRAYDKAHRLHRERKTKTFLMRPDNAIATEIAASVGLIPRVDPTGGPQQYLCQRNQTDWEFLLERARENGFELQVANNQLIFRRAGADPTAGLPQSLTFGDALLSFRIRATSAEQARSTTVRAFNPVLKQPVMGMAPPPRPESTATDPRLQPMVIGARFGATADVRTNRPFELPPQAMKQANARRNHTATVALEAEGRCFGNPALRPGGKVTVDGVGRSFGGSYTISSVRHRFDRNGYYTSFTVSGLHDRTLLGLTRPGAVTRADTRRDAAKLDAPVIATVSNNADPQMLGRVKVKLPWLADDAESHWAPVVSVGAGPSRGLQVLPEVQDTVLVVFEEGDVRRPYVLGGIYNVRDRTPLGPTPPPVAGGKTNIRTFTTRAGHQLTFDDTTGQETITLASKGGAKVEIKDTPESITVSDKSGQNKVTVDGAGQKVVLEAAANLELKAEGMVKIEGTGGIELKTPAMLKLEGTGGLNAKSSGPTTVEGSVTTVKSSGPMTVQGTPLKLN